MDNALLRRDGRKQRPSKRARQRMRRKMERLHFEQDGHNFISSESGYDTTGDPANTPLHSPSKAFLLQAPRTMKERPLTAPISEGDQSSPSDAEVAATSASRNDDDETKLEEEGESLFTLH